MNQSHRGTVFLEDAEVLSHDHVADEQHILRLAAPRTAAHAVPGTFVHLRCTTALPLRRPLSIMRADPKAGWIELLYKSVGAGTRALAEQPPGQSLSLIGPIGRGFRYDPARPRTVLIGGGVGIPPMIFFADRLRDTAPDASTDAAPVVFMGSEAAFPFDPRPSEIILDGAPPEAIACVPLLDDWGIPSRLASGQGFAGCYDGFVTELAAHWLAHLDPSELAAVSVFACGPTPMLEASAALARRFAVPAQICLEEFMACGVGGCAGCVVPVHDDGVTAMRRVCVDGPVFDAATIYPSPA